MATKKLTRVDGKTGRFYTLPDGRVVPSVTTIISASAKPALINWAAKEERLLCLDVAADMYEDVLKGVAPMSRSTYISSMDSRIGKQRAYKRTMDKAAEIGSQAHAMIEYLLRKQMGQDYGVEPKLADKAMWAVMAWEDWAKSVKLEPIAVEQMIWSDNYGYAGTMDLLAKVNGKLAVLDWKTGKAIYPAEHFLQNAAYRKAVEEMGHGIAETGYIVRLPKTETDPDFEVREVGSIDDVFPVFLSLMSVWSWGYHWELAYQADRKAAKAEAESTEVPL
jgi:hypothetical protein